MRINVKPHEGLNDIGFGLRSAEVRIKLGVPEFTREESIKEYGKVSITEPKTDFYFENSLHISYDKNDTVEFIEIACKNSDLEVSIFEISLNQVSAIEVISFLTRDKKLEYNKNGVELPYSYDFVAKDLTFWRQVLPENEKDEDGKYFNTVGIGRVGYLEE